MKLTPPFSLIGKNAVYGLPTAFHSKAATDLMILIVSKSPVKVAVPSVPFEIA